MAEANNLTKMEQAAYSTRLITETAALNSCELQAVYHFNTDSTITYTESLRCRSNGNGRW